MRSCDPWVMVLVLFEMPPQKKFKQKIRSLEKLPAGHSTASQPPVWFTPASALAKAPLLLFHKPCLIYFLSKKNLCTSFKLTRLSKTTSRPLSWGSKTTNFWGYEGLAHVSGSQHLARWRTGCYILQGDSFNCAAWARWQKCSWVRDLYTGIQN